MSANGILNLASYGLLVHLNLLSAKTNMQSYCHWEKLNLITCPPLELLRSRFTQVFVAKLHIVNVEPALLRNFCKACLQNDHNCFLSAC